MMNDTPKKEEMFPRHSYESIIESCRRLEPDVVQRIGTDRPVIMQTQAQLGQVHLANQRIDHFQSVTKRRWNPQLKQWVMGSIILLGAVTFSTGFQTVFKKMGTPLAAGGGALVGALVAYFAEDRSTRFLAKYRSRKDSEATITAIEQQHRHHEPQTPIVDTYFNEQKALVRQIEKEHLIINARMDLFLAVVMSLIEAGIAFGVVFATSSWTFALLSATLPVSVIWIVAAFQSDRFEFADACEALISIYENYIPASDEVSEEEMLTVVELGAVVQHLSGNSKNSDKSLAQERFSAEAKFSYQRKTHYEKAKIEAERDIYEQHKQAVTALPDKFPKPTIDITDLSPGEQKMQERVIAGQKEEWLADEKVKLDRDLEEKLQRSCIYYAQRINSWQARALKAEENAQNATNSKEQEPDNRDDFPDLAA